MKKEESSINLPAHNLQQQGNFQGQLQKPDVSYIDPSLEQVDSDIK